MAKFIPHDYKQMVMPPLYMEDQLSPGTLEFAIHYLVETRMDLSVFDEKYKNDETGPDLPPINVPPLELEFHPF